jgi:hypothetical protein
MSRTASAVSTVTKFPRPRSRNSSGVFHLLVVQADGWLLVPARWTPYDGYAVIVDLDSSNPISLNKLKGIAKTRG